METRTQRTFQVFCPACPYLAPSSLSSLIVEGYSGRDGEHRRRRPATVCVTITASSEQGKIEKLLGDVELEPKKKIIVPLRGFHRDR